MKGGSDGPGSFFVARVGLAISGFGKFPFKNIAFSHLSSLRIKKISFGQVKIYGAQKRVDLLFTGRQKYACVGSGSISKDWSHVGYPPDFHPGSLFWTPALGNQP